MWGFESLLPCQTDGEVGHGEDGITRRTIEGNVRRSSRVARWRVLGADQAAPKALGRVPARSARGASPGHLAHAPRSGRNDVRGDRGCGFFWSFLFRRG